MIWRRCWLCRWGFGWRGEGRPFQGVSFSLSRGRTVRRRGRQPARPPFECGWCGWLYPARPSLVKAGRHPHPQPVRHSDAGRLSPARPAFEPERASSRSPIHPLGARPLAQAGCFKLVRRLSPRVRHPDLLPIRWGHALSSRSAVSSSSGVEAERAPSRSPIHPLGSRPLAQVGKISLSGV